MSLVNEPIFGLVPTLGLGLATGLATFVQYSTTRFCLYPRQPCLYPCGHFLNDALESVCDLLQSIGFVRPRILVSGFEIEEAQEQFKEKCKQFTASAKSCIWSKHGSQPSQDMYRPNRYQNIFGFNEAAKEICEINIIGHGIDRSVGGAFVKDSLERVFIIHRGNRLINLPKDFFDKNFRGKWMRVKDGSTMNNVALVDTLEAPEFGHGITFFVAEVDRMRNQVSGNGSTHRNSFHHVNQSCVSMD